LKFWFWIDLISIFPVEASQRLFVEHPKGNRFDVLKIQKLVRITRIFKIAKVFQVFAKIMRLAKNEEKYNTSCLTFLTNKYEEKKTEITAMWTFFVTMVVFFYSNHIGACLWAMLGETEA
jgi:hypothetical protein